MSEATNNTERRAKTRLAGAAVARGTVAVLLTVPLGMLVYGPQPNKAAPVAATASVVVEDVQRVGLVQKDRNWDIIPPTRGGASGSVWYLPQDATLAFQLRASRLVPHQPYVLAVAVDSTDYAIAIRSADAHGELALDSTLTQFASGAFAGAFGDPPQPLRGPHTISFRIDRDNGARASPPVRPDPSRSQPCPGDGHRPDGCVLQGDAARFTGT